MPAGMAKSIDDIVAKGNYASKSEFFRDLLRMWMEGKILRELGESRRELSSGKGQVLRTLKDLR